MRCTFQEKGGTMMNYSSIKVNENLFLATFVNIPEGTVETALHDISSEGGSHGIVLNVKGCPSTHRIYEVFATPNDLERIRIRTNEFMNKYI
jgi:hypothetical protein